MDDVLRGKIGHLPKDLQELVSRRLEQGENGRTVVALLNALPEVQALLAAEFAGKPIRERCGMNYEKCRWMGGWVWSLGRQAGSTVLLSALQNGLGPENRQQHRDAPPRSGNARIRLNAARRTLALCSCTGN